MKSKLYKEITDTFDELTAVFAAFTDKQINTIPHEGSWTAGQVAEHIIKSISNLPEFLNENTEQTFRESDLHVSPIKKLFLDFSIKMTALDFITPSAPPHNKITLLNSFRKLKEEMVTAVETLDLSMTCKSFEFPGFGFLTRLEWLSFFLAHTQRHTYQLKNIYQEVNA